MKHITRERKQLERLKLLPFERGYWEDVNLYENQWTENGQQSLVSARNSDKNSAKILQFLHLILKNI